MTTICVNVMDGKFSENYSLEPSSHELSITCKKSGSCASVFEEIARHYRVSTSEIELVILRSGKYSVVREYESVQSTFYYGVKVMAYIVIVHCC